MVPEERLKKTQELLELYKQLNIPSDDEFHILLLFVRALCDTWTVNRVSNSLD